MNFELPYMAKLQRQNRMILVIDKNKQKATPFCQRLSTGLYYVVKTVITDWITVLIFSIFSGSFIFLMVACGLKEKK